MSSKGVIVVLSGGFFDEMNPKDVRDRMDEYIADVGLEFKLLWYQPSPHIHQVYWRWVARLRRSSRRHSSSSATATAAPRR
jgi:hypothetical protein